MKYCDLKIGQKFRFEFEAESRPDWTYQKVETISEIGFGSYTAILETSNPLSKGSPRIAIVSNSFLNREPVVCIS